MSLPSSNTRPAFDTVYEMTTDVLGAGSFSTVYRCIHRTTKAEFAVKVVEKSFENSNARNTMKKHHFELAIDRIQAEMNILQMCKHPNVITLHECFNEGERIYMIFQWAKGGDLFDKCCKVGRFSEEQALMIAVELLCAALYIHSRGILHRDIKLENILVNKTPSGGFSVTLADFGLAKQVGILQNKKPLYHSPCGTPGYMAPEIMCQDAYHKAADIFAIGVSLYTIVAGVPPFDVKRDVDGCRPAKYKTADFTGKVWDKVSQDGKDFISGLMEVDVKKRMGACEALSHRWLKEGSVLRACLRDPVNKKVEHALQTSKEMALAAGAEWSPAISMMNRQNGPNMSTRRMQMQRKIGQITTTARLAGTNA